MSVETLARQIAHNDSRRDEERELDKRYAVMAEARLVDCGGAAPGGPRAATKSELQALKQDWDRRSTLPKNDLPKLASASGARHRARPRPRRSSEKILVHRGEN